MTRGTGRRWAGALLGATLALAPLAQAAAQAASPQAFRAPGAKPAETSDEGGLWDESGKSEAKLKASAEVNHDPALNAYVRSVVCRIAAEYCDELRVYVLDAPVFNAFVAPNGYVAVYSGLLLRARTEDELAYVLGHEISHFARNHTLAVHRSRKNTANGTMLVSLAIGAAATGAAYSVASSGAAGSYDTINSIGRLSNSLIDLTYLIGVSRLFRFNREQESEADQLGYARAVKAGYAGRAAPAIWEDVVAEQKASDFARVRNADAQLGIFDTHPLTADRIAALKKLQLEPSAPSEAAGHPSPEERAAALTRPEPAASANTPEDAARRYRAAVRPHLAAWIKDDLRRRDWGEVQHVLDRLESEGEDLGAIRFYRGEVYRLRRKDGDLALARGAYASAVAQPDAPSAAWRELGEACRKLGDKAAARAAFTAYLDHAPEAQDRWLVEAGLKTL